MLFILFFLDGLINKKRLGKERDNYKPGIKTHGDAKRSFIKNSFMSKYTILFESIYDL